MSERPLPPKAEKKPHTIEQHGANRNDSHHWLRAENWQDVLNDPQKLPDNIRVYLDEENAYTDAMMADTESLQNELFEELKSFEPPSDTQVPVKKGDWLYYTRHEEGLQYGIHCRKPAVGGEEQVILDANKEAESKDYYKIGQMKSSRDHRYMAYAVDENGSESFDVRFIDMKTGEKLADIIYHTGASMEWNDHNQLLYAQRDPIQKRVQSIFCHTLGEKDEQDELVYHTDDTTMYNSLTDTRDGSFIVLERGDHTKTESFICDASQKIEHEKEDQNVFTLFAPMRDDTEYYFEHRKGMFYILTNADGATDFKLMTCDADNTAPENWQELVPEREGVMLRSFSLHKDFLVLQEIENALPRLLVHGFDAQNNMTSPKTISFDEAAYEIDLKDVNEFSSSEFRFVYTSPVTPSQVIDCEALNDIKHVRKTVYTPEHYNSENYCLSRIEAPAEDGEKVPVTIMHHKDTPLDGSAPLFLKGYGAYGMAYPVSFDRRAIVMANRGFVTAIAHIRGGTEKGYPWHLDGKMMKKKNTFTDFIASAKKLCAQQYTSKGRIFAAGGSAGGMLIGAVANMAPDLWGALHADVPFVDVVNTISDPTLPLTPPEWLEWGNPIKDKDAFDYMMSYSPYDNIEGKDYPPMLVSSSLTDSRVTYWEPAKYVARLRENKTDDNPLLMKMEMATGHGGASGRFDFWKEYALAYAFAMKALGVENQPSSVQLSQKNQKHNSIQRR